MAPLDDDLLTWLRAARPDPGYQPSAASPEATAMLARVLQAGRDRAPRGAGRGPARRVTRRRLLLAGVPALAAAAAAAVLVVAATSAGPASTRPSVSAVRTAVLDAFQQASGDIVDSIRTIQLPREPVMTQRAWTYPAFPAVGQQVRFRLFIFRGGTPEQDTESIYVQTASAGQLSQPTTQCPCSSQYIDVEYATRTWSRGDSSSVLLAGPLSPALIRDEIASGRFTVLGQVNLDGRQAIKVTWSTSPGRVTTLTTTLWVDARTYLPLRSVTTDQAQAGARDVLLSTDTTNYQILPATPATLDLLNPPIPAGFTRTATSPNF
jgi:hypothetical protein